MRPITSSKSDNSTLTPTSKVTTSTYCHKNHCRETSAILDSELWFALTLPDTNPSDVLKNTLIKHVSVSKRCNIHKLLHAKSACMGIGNPSNCFVGHNSSLATLKVAIYKPFTSRLSSHPGKSLWLLELTTDSLTELIGLSSCVATIESPEFVGILYIRSDLSKVLKLLEIRRHNTAPLQSPLRLKLFTLTLSVHYHNPRTSRTFSPALIAPNYMRSRCSI